MSKAMKQATLKKLNKMDLKEAIVKLISQSGLENKEVVLILDKVRKMYHNPKNVGDKIVSQKELSKMVAHVRKENYPLSKDRKSVFFRGSWHKVKSDTVGKYFIYLGNYVYFTIKRK